MRVGEMNWMQVETYLERDDDRYRRPDDEMQAIRDVAVGQTRAPIEGPWR